MSKLVENLVLIDSIQIPRVDHFGFGISYLGDPISRIQHLPATVEIRFSGTQQSIEEFLYFANEFMVAGLPVEIAGAHPHEPPPTVEELPTLPSAPIEGILEDP
jgi:hypothetical protein